MEKKELGLWDRIANNIAHAVETPAPPKEITPEVRKQFKESVNDTFQKRD